MVQSHVHAYSTYCVNGALPHEAQSSNGNWYVWYSSGSTHPRHYEDSGICYSDAPRICDTHKLRYLTGRGVLVQKRQYIKSRGLGDLIPDVVSEILAGKDGTHVTRSHYPWLRCQRTDSQTELSRWMRPSHWDVGMILRRDENLSSALSCSSRNPSHGAKTG